MSEEMIEGRVVTQVMGCSAERGHRGHRVRPWTQSQQIVHVRVQVFVCASFCTVYTCALECVCVCVCVHLPWQCRKLSAQWAGWAVSDLNLRAA